MEKTFREVIADIKPGEVWESKYKTVTITMDKHGVIRIINKAEISEKFMVFTNTTTYKRKDTAVSFEEVLNSDKWCKVEHDLLKDRKNFDNYMEFDDLILELSETFLANNLRSILKEGKWYLEE